MSCGFQSARRNSVRARYESTNGSYFSACSEVDVTGGRAPDWERGDKGTGEQDLNERQKEHKQLVVGCAVQAAHSKCTR